MATDCKIADLNGMDTFQNLVAAGAAGKSQWSSIHDRVAGCTLL